jgi:hypothetical protein
MAPRAFQQVPMLRACVLCLHSTGQHLALSCSALAVVQIHGTDTPVQQARKAGAACGPDARHLDMPSWQPRRGAL